MPKDAITHTFYNVKLDKRMEVRPRHFEGMERIEVERMNVVIFDREIIRERI